MVRTSTLALAVTLVSLVVAPRAPEAQGRGKAKRAQASAAAGFTAAERDLVVRYYADHPDAGKRLPPGIAKKLARGKPLPPPPPPPPNPPPPRPLAPRPPPPPVLGPPPPGPRLSSCHTR